jgi:hypothetical protein
MLRVSLEENDVRGAVLPALLHDVELHLLPLSHRALIARLGKRGEVDEHAER